MRTDNLLAHYTRDDEPAARSALGAVLDACRDGALGYATASGLVDAPQLQEMFRTLSQQRSQFARILEQHSLWLGGAPEPGPQAAGVVHRKWMEVRGKLDHGVAVALLAECERGEHSALKRYEHALGIPMPEDLRQILLSQIVDVRRAHDRLDGMRRR